VALLIIVVGSSSSFGIILMTFRPDQTVLPVVQSDGHESSLATTLPMARNISANQSNSLHAFQLRADNLSVGSSSPVTKAFSNLTSARGNYLHDHDGATNGPLSDLGQIGSVPTIQQFPKVQSQAGSGESVSTVTSFVGLHYGYNGFLWNGAAPPDVQIAAGTSNVVEMVNLLGAVFTKQGSTVSTFSLASFFGTGSDYITDPKILYDTGSGRWFATLEDGSTESIHLAISASSDPTSNWYFYTIPEVHGYCPDQPILGISSDQVAISVNNYSSCSSETSSSFTGAEYWILEKSALLTGSYVYWEYFGPNTGLFSVHPVQSLSTTNTLYMVSTWAGGTNVVRLFVVTGVPPGTVNVQTTDIPINPTSFPANAAQLGTSNLVNVNDNRVLDARLYGQEIWLTFNDGCVPSGDTQVRTCARYVEIDTSTNSKVQDFTVGYPGLYYYYPALSIDTSGNMLTMFGYSSSSTYPSLAVSGQGTFDSPNSIEALQAAFQGSGFESEYCPTSGVCRYGDYFGAATDPASGNMVWLAGEYGTESGWSTFIEEVSLQSPGVATTIDLVPVGSSTPLSNSNEFTVSYTFGGVNKTTYDNGQPITVAADSGTYIWFSATASGSSANEKWVFDSQAPSVGIPAGTTSTLYYYDLLSEPASYTVVDGGSPPPPSIAFDTAPPTLPSQATILYYSQALTQSQQTIWALRGTTVSATGAIPGAPLEQWIPQTSSWSISQPNQVAAPILYYHQYQVSFDFVVNNGGTGYSPPTVAYSSFGTSQTTGISTPVWSDAGAYQFENELPGSSSVERWAAGTGGTGSIGFSGTYTAQYYHQFVLGLTYVIVGGGNPSPPELSMTNLGQSGSFIISGSPGVRSSVWIDAGSAYQLSPLLPGSTSSERWYGNGISGVASGYSTLTSTYYHQFYIDAAYVIEGGGNPSAPTLVFSAEGTPSSYQLTQSPSFMWIDDNHWGVASTLVGSTGTERWAASTDTNGTANSDAPISPHYYHQFAFVASYSTSDNSVAQPPAFTSAQFGSQISKILGGASTTYWVDDGASWGVNGLLGGSSSTERWTTRISTSGTVTSAQTLHFVFLHQFYVTIQTGQPSGGSLTPTGWYNATSSLQLTAKAAPGWQFESWSGTGQGAYSGNNNTQAIKVESPLVESATFYPGLIITNGGDGQVTYSWGTKQPTGVSGTTTIFVPVGTNVSLSANPSLLFVFGEYSGSVNSAKAEASMVVNTPASVSVTFNPNIPVIGGIVGIGVVGAAAFYFFRLRGRRPRLPPGPS
jgi:Divergent InlB B-repeat domain